MFTIWKVNIGDFGSNFNYLQNIGHTAEVAQSKAKEIAERMGLELMYEASGELRKIMRGKRNPEVLCIGKFAGSTIEDVFEANAPYLKWYLETKPAGSKHHAQFFNVLKDYLESHETEFAAKRDEGKESNIMYVGKHAGKHVEEIPVDYLPWLCDQDMDSNHSEFQANCKAHLAKMNADKPVSKHVGENGERIEIEVECERVHTYVNDYGYGAIVTYVDAEGNKLVYKGSGSHLSKGCKGIIRGTVSSHDEFRGECQTRLKRVKVLTTNETEGEEA